jgi:hypothetical protein
LLAIQYYSAVAVKDKKKPHLIQAGLNRRGWSLDSDTSDSTSVETETTFFKEAVETDLLNTRAIHVELAIR